MFLYKRKKNESILYYIHIIVILYIFIYTSIHSSLGVSEIFSVYVLLVLFWFGFSSFYILFRIWIFETDKTIRFVVHIEYLVSGPQNVGLKCTHQQIAGKKAHTDIHTKTARTPTDEEETLTVSVYCVCVVMQYSIWYVFCCLMYLAEFVISLSSIRKVLIIQSEWNKTVAAAAIILI